MTQGQFGSFGEPDDSGCDTDPYSLPQKVSYHVPDDFSLDSDLDIDHPAEAVEPGNGGNPTLKWAVSTVAVILATVAITVGVIIALDSPTSEAPTAAATSTSESASTSPASSAPANATTRLLPGAHADEQGVSEPTQSAEDSSSASSPDHQSILSDMNGLVSDIFAGLGLEHSQDLDATAQKALETIGSGEAVFEPYSFYAYTVDSNDSDAWLIFRILQQDAERWLSEFEFASRPEMSSFGTAVAYSDTYYYVVVATH